MRPKSFPFGFPDRGDGILGAVAAAPPPLAGCWDRAVEGAGAAEVGEGPGGADMRLRSLPFPLGGAIVVVFVM